MPSGGSAWPRGHDERGTGVVPAGTGESGSRWPAGVLVALDEHHVDVCLALNQAGVRQVVCSLTRLQPLHGRASTSRSAAACRRYAERRPGNPADRGRAGIRARLRHRRRVRAVLRAARPAGPRWPCRPLRPVVTRQSLRPCRPSCPVSPFDPRTPARPCWFQSSSVVPLGHVVPRSWTTGMCVP
jgi:hypothetical protein